MQYQHHSNAAPAQYRCMDNGLQYQEGRESARPTTRCSNTKTVESPGPASKPHFGRPRSGLVMAAALLRPIAAERSRLPQSCREVARHGPRKMNFGEIGELRVYPSVLQQLPNNCSGSPSSAQIRRPLADLGCVGQVWPRWRKFDQLRPQIGPLSTNMVALGRCLPRSVQIWPTIGQGGRLLPRLVNIQTTSTDVSQTRP